MRRLQLSGDSRIVIYLLWITIIFAVVSCVQTPQTRVEPTKLNASEPAVQTSSPITSESHNPQAGLQAEPTQKPEIQPTQKPQVTVTPDTVTVTSTRPLNDEAITGQLFIFEPNGFHQIKLPGGEMKNLFETENDLSNWGARFAQNKKLLAYWIKQDSGTELWFTPLADWQPELLLTVNDLEYDFATPLWGVNDRYLFFLLFVLDNSGPFEDVKTLRTYIFDTKTMDLVGSSYWPGECSILAPSLSSGQIALWCHQPEQQDQEYLVLEPEQDPWFTKDTPNVLVDKCVIYAKCDWSQDGEFVVYVDMDKYPEEMFYSSVKDPKPIQINDGVTKAYSFPLWSSNSQLLYYAGDCYEGGLQNPTVITVVDQEIIWCTGSISNRGEFPNLDVSRVTWSPNGNFLAMPFSPHNEEEILIFDVVRHEKRERIMNVGNFIMDIIWVDD